MPRFWVEVVAYAGGNVLYQSGAFADGSLVTTPRRSSNKDAPTHVPAALQIYTVEAPDLRRYDALLRASA